MGQQHIITFRKELVWVETNPTHITATKDSILDFRRTIAEDNWADARAEKPKQLAKYAVGINADSERDRIVSSFENGERLKDWAKSISTSDTSARHNHWRNYYEESFVTRLRLVEGAKESPGSLPASQDECYSFLKYAASALNKIGGEDGSKKTVVCRPYTTFSLPVESVPALQDIPPSKADSWKHLLFSNLLDTFSDATAEHLANLGYEYDHSRSENDEAGTDAVFFPFFAWDFDEFTHEPCQCSTTNICHISRLRAGTVCAVAMGVFHRLVRFAAGEEENVREQQIPVPPMVTMTFCGQHTRIWIAHQRTNRSPIRIDCIWKGDMCRLRDVVELEIIFGNILKWATFKFRNIVSHCVRSWRKRFPPPLSDKDDDEMEQLIARIGNLKISRTNSFPLGKQPSTEEDAAQGDIWDVSNKALEISNVQIIVDALETTTIEPQDQQPSTPAVRKNLARPAPELLVTPPQSRQRGSSVGAYTFKNLNASSSSSHLSSGGLPDNDGSPRQRRTKKMGGTRPRSFDASEFQDCNFFAFDTPRKAVREGGRSRSRVRYFSGHGLEAERFTFEARPSDAESEQRS